MAVDYPNLDSFTGGDIVEFIKLPNSSYPFYWTLMIIGIWIVVTLSLYFAERESTTKGKMLGAMAVSAFAVIVLATIGSLMGILTLETFLPLLVGGLVIIAIWIFS